MKTNLKKIIANKKIKVSFKPTKKTIAEIESWLIEERDLTDEGFYCNWNSILSSFSKKTLATLSIDKQTIGFAAWSSFSGFTATIEIVEIKPTHRNQGFGKQLISHLIKYFIDNNIVVTNLQCAPASSEPIWRRFGFMGFPESESNQKNNELYKILIPHLPSTEFCMDNETIELWNDEPYFTKDIDSIWKWNLVFKEGTRQLLKPIISPCQLNWRIRWKKEGKTIKDDKVKYFSKDEIKFGKFLIITKMPE